MFILEVTFDSEAAAADDLLAVVGVGDIVAVSGVRNLHSERLSAERLAQHRGFDSVIWDDVEDDTSGSLTVAVRLRSYPSMSLLACLSVSRILDAFAASWEIEDQDDRERR